MANPFLLRLASTAIRHVQFSLPIGASNKAEDLADSDPAHRGDIYMQQSLNSPEEPHADLEVCPDGMSIQYRCAPLSLERVFACRREHGNWVKVANRWELTHPLVATRTFGSQDEIANRAISVGAGNCLEQTAVAYKFLAAAIRTSDKVQSLGFPLALMKANLHRNDHCFAMLVPASQLEVHASMMGPSVSFISDLPPGVVICDPWGAKKRFASGFADDAYGVDSMDELNDRMIQLGFRSESLLLRFELANVVIVP